jgi:hypothetical protein
MALIVVSVPRLVAMAREAVAKSRAFNQYEVRQIHINETTFYGHKIQLSDQVGIQKGEGIEESGKLTIMIDGKDYSTSERIRIRPAFTNSNRYHLWAALVLLKDFKAKSESLAIVESLSNTREPLMRYRVLFVEPDGKVLEEVFSDAERAHPLYRTMLANWVRPSSTGFTSNVLNEIPSIFCPFLYPFASGMIGLLLLVWSIAEHAHRRLAQAHESSQVAS